MQGEPRTDRPRTNAEPAELSRKRALRDAPHVHALTRYVGELRKRRGGDKSIPWFDPTEAGTSARILLLLEAPGRKAAKGSRFVSPDNDDGSAQNMWELLREAEVDRGREVVTWNVIPWYVGTDRRIRAARRADIEEGHQALVDLLGLLPDVRVVVLLGKAAQRAWDLVGVGVPTILAPHPSPKNVNTRPAARREILHAVVEARARAEFTDHRAHTAPDRSHSVIKPHTPRSATRSRRVSTARRDDTSPAGRLVAVRDALRAGLTPDQIYARMGKTRAVWLMAIEEEARLQGEFDAFAASTENIVMLRDRRRLRWERIAVRVFGDPRSTAGVRDLYDAAKGQDASKRSYTGRGRRFSEMDDA